MGKEASHNDHPFSTPPNICLAMDQPTVLTSRGSRLYSFSMDQLELIPLPSEEAKRTDWRPMDYRRQVREVELIYRRDRHAPATLTNASPLHHQKPYTECSNPCFGIRYASAWWSFVLIQRTSRLLTGLSAKALSTPVLFTPARSCTSLSEHLPPRSSSHTTPQRKP